MVAALSAASFMVLAQKGWTQTLKPDEMKLVKEVNRTVNGEIRYLSDQANYGVENLPVTEPKLSKPEGLPKGKYGDCEDYALTKAHRLKMLGFDKNRLTVTTVEVPKRPNLHAVLLIKDGFDHLVLDSYDNLLYKKSQLVAKGWNFNYRPDGFASKKKGKAEQTDQEAAAHVAMREMVAIFDKNKDGQVTMDEMNNFTRPKR
jgi:predicted transglutaminase-like cysteine proteinase